MRRFGLFPWLFLVVLVAACGSGHRHHAAFPPTTVHFTPVVRTTPRIAYTAVGVTLTPAPPGYRASVSRAKVLTLLRHTAAWRFIEPQRNPTVRLQLVSEGRPGRDAFPGWVVTNRRPGSNCSFVSIYSLHSRVWIWQFRSCTHRTNHPSCDFGCTPANEDALDSAANEAERIATAAYWTGAGLDYASNTVTVNLAHAPGWILARLRAAHPGIYVIYNHAPRPLRAVLKIMRSIVVAKLRADGIRITGFGPTIDGHLQVGVSNRVAQARAKLDAIYGPDLIRVVKQAPAVAF
jgi:hypothetical protein